MTKAWFCVCKLNMGFLAITMTHVLPPQSIYHSIYDMGFVTVSKARALSLLLRYGFDLRSLDKGFVIVAKSSVF